MPPALRPVREAALSCADEPGRSVVDALSGLRTSTDWPACAAAWCPQPQTASVDQPATLVLAVGTYRLEESDAPASSLEPEPELGQPSVGNKSSSDCGGFSGAAAAGDLRDADPEQRERQRRQQHRNGTIRLYQLSVNPSSASTSDSAAHAHVGEQGPVAHCEEEVRHWRPVSAQEEQSVTRLAAGALDIKWCPWLLRHPGSSLSQLAETGTDDTVKAGPAVPAEADTQTSPPLLGVACADGTIRLLQLHEDRDNVTNEQQKLLALRTQRALEADAVAAGNFPPGTPARTAAAMRLEECAVGCVFRRLGCLGLQFYLS